MISIVIPVFNTPIERFKRCIDSILSNSYSDYQILIINDGSREDISSKYKELSKIDNRIRYIKTVNQGPALARNQGVDLADGEYVTFVDADDYICSHCLQQAQEMIEKYEPDIIIGLVHMNIAAQMIESRFKDQYDSILHIQSYEEKVKLIDHMIGYTSKKFEFEGSGYIGDGPVARVFKKELFHKIKFDEKPYWSEDTIWNIQFINSCKSIIVLESVWYVYDIYENSLTQGFRNHCPEEFAFRIKQEYDLLYNIFPDHMKGAYYRIWHDIFTLCKTFIFHPQNHQTYIQKYDTYLKAITQKEYILALKGVDYSFELSMKKRILKKFLKENMLYGPKILSFIILRIYCKKLGFVKE